MNKKFILLLVFAFAILFIVFLLHKKIGTNEKQTILSEKQDFELLNEPKKDFIEEKYAITSVMINGVNISLSDEESDVKNLFNQERMIFVEYDGYLIVESSLAVYFEDNLCTRLSFLSESPYTMGNIRIGSSYEEMVHQYGEEYEKTVYNHKGRYDIYCYFTGENIIEFCILENGLQQIYKIEIYNSKIAPLYDHGEIVEQPH